ncbi:hypothetical protein AnigIFM63326_003700 [Aspergillus niger]|nr:hypothetical protein AnigIFM63326_003700 [Aspergillus niger]
MTVEHQPRPEPVLFPNGGWDVHHHIFEPAKFAYAPDRHLTPPPATVQQFLAFKEKIGITNSVLTHGLSYGPDCTSLKAFVQELGESGTRGIGVIDPDKTTPEELQEMHKQGIRGIRVNLYQYQAMHDVERQKQALRDHIRAIKPHCPGWSIAFTHVHPEYWGELKPIIEEEVMSSSLHLVTDHFALLKAASMLPAEYEGDITRQPGFTEIMDLVRSGLLYVKLSAPYRVSHEAPRYADVKPLVRAFVDANPRQILWGSDWPHTPHMKVRTREEALRETPYLVIDDAEWLKSLRSWVTAEEWQAIMVSNPTRLALKVRCLPDPNVPRQCQRCTRTRRTCVFARTLRRQPRKKTGSRVAQLERDVRDLRSLLHDQIRSDPDRGEKTDDAAAAATTTDPPGAAGRDVASFPALSSSMHMELPSVHNTSAQGDSDQHARNLPAETAPTSTNLTMMQSTAGSGDVVDRGIISLDMAQMLVSFFVNEQMQFYPMVVLPPNTSAESLRRTSPVLFLSILAASSMTLNPHISETLNEEMLKLFADRFFLRQEKSVELIQSILLMLIFYFPPKSRLQGQYYQYTHIATTMTLELGIAAGPAGRKNYRCHGGYGDLPASIHSAQARAVLGCYHFASNIGIRTHRPNMLRFNDVIDGYICHLRESTNGLDQQIATWFDIQRIVDDTLYSLGHDNTLVDVHFRESQMLPILKWFDSRMLRWKRTTPKNMLTTWMNLEYHYMYLAIYELAAGEGYRDPDAPTRKYYTLPPLEGDMERHKANVPLSAARVQIITKWMLAAHQMLDAFLECDTSTMRKLPNMTYTRMVLGISSLLRIYHTAQFGPLGEVITSNMMDVDGYLDRVSEALSRASGEQKYRVPSKWYHVVAIKNREWYEQLQKRIIARPGDTHTYLRGGVPPPAPGVPILEPHRGPGSAAILPSLGSGMAGPAYAEPWYVDDAAGRVDPSRPFPAMNAPVLYMGQMQPVEGDINEAAFPLPLGDEPWRLDESIQDSVTFPY